MIFLYEVLNQKQESQLSSFNPEIGRLILHNCVRAGGQSNTHLSFFLNIKKKIRGQKKRTQRNKVFL